MSSVYDAAWLLLEDVTGMLASIGEKEPERLERPGWKRMAEHAAALEGLLDASTADLSDPERATPGPVRAGALATERAAALAVMPKTGTIRQEVLALIAIAEDGMTHPELEEKLAGRAAPSSVRTRCSELVTGGWVADSGNTRLTRAGLDATVWILTMRGRAELGLGAPPERSLFD